MRKLSQFEIRRELARQRGRLIDLLDGLDDKDLGREYKNAALIKRRRYYQPKNNGRGRPAKKFQVASKEDEARRIQYIADIRLLDEAIAFAALDCDALTDWLESLKQEGGEGEEWRARERKIKKLLGQFGKKPAKAPSTARKWSHNDVRNYVTILHDRQRGRVKAFERLPVVTVAEQDEEDREWAKLAVLERFCTSNHLVTAQVFQQRASIVRMEVNRLRKPHDESVYRDAWFQAFDGFVTALTNRYGVS
jgi:hypothetical protein